MSFGIQILERSIAGMEEKLQDVIRKQNEPDLRRQGTVVAAAGGSSDPREHGLLTESPDGTVTWRIDKFTQVRRAACNGLQAYISSPAFFAGPCGYKMKIRFFADGDGTAKGKAFSLFIQLQRGPYDDLLLWPFTGKVSFVKCLLLPPHLYLSYLLVFFYHQLCAAAAISNLGS